MKEEDTQVPRSKQTRRTREVNRTDRHAQTPDSYEGWTPSEEGWRETTLRGKEDAREVGVRARGRSPTGFLRKRGKDPRTTSG